MANLADMKQKNAATTNIATMKPKDQIAHILKTKQAEIQKMLPKHLNAERLLKVAQIAATTTPALLKCDVPSLVGAIGQCAQMGLEPNTVLGHAYLVPFNTKRKVNGVETWVNSVQVIIGYKGLIDLARRSGQITSISAHEVRKNDKFELVYGLNEKLEHTPAMGDRGEIIGFYAIAKFTGGGYSFEFMSAYEVDMIKHATQSKGAYGPWKDHYSEMGRKTVIRRLAKYLPLSIEFQTAVAIDNAAAAEKDQFLENTLDGDFSIVDDDAMAYAGEQNEQGQTAAIEQNESPTMQQEMPAGSEAAADEKFKKFAHRIANATDIDMLDADADLIREFPAEDQEILRKAYAERKEELTGGAKPAARPRRQMNVD